MLGYAVTDRDHDRLVQELAILQQTSPPRPGPRLTARKHWRRRQDRAQRA